MHVTLIDRAMALLTRIAETLSHIADLQEATEDPESRRRLSSSAVIDANGRAVIEFDTLPGSTWEVLSFAGVATAAAGGRVTLYYDAEDPLRVFHTLSPLDVIFSRTINDGESVPDESKIVAVFSGLPAATVITLNLQLLQRNPEPQHRTYARGRGSHEPQGIPLPHVDTSGVDTSPHIPMQRAQR